MSVRSEIIQIIPHFTHDPEYLEERSRFRGLMRSLTVAEDRIKGKKATRRKKSGNTSPSPIESEGTG